MNQNNKLANDRLKDTVEKVNGANKNRENFADERQISSSVLTQEDSQKIILTIDSILKTEDGVNKCAMVTNLINYLQTITLMK